MARTGPELARPFPRVALDSSGGTSTPVLCFGPRLVMALVQLTEVNLLWSRFYGRFKAHFLLGYVLQYESSGLLYLLWGEPSGDLGGDGGLGQGRATAAGVWFASKDGGCFRVRQPRGRLNGFAPAPKARGARVSECVCADAWPSAPRVRHLSHLVLQLSVWRLDESFRDSPPRILSAVVQPVPTFSQLAKLLFFLKPSNRCPFSQVCKSKVVRELFEELDFVVDLNASKFL